MPSIDWNRSIWSEAGSWSDHGDEWSRVWGGVETHWFATILPRIRNFLPTGTILEIAPGHGRWSGFLLSSCARYIGIDLAEECVTFCRERYRTAENATFFANDGKSLPMIADGSIDFVFSFDSLVHAESDVIDAYMAELSRVLAPDGVGFIHHSNLGAHLRAVSLDRFLTRATARWPFAVRALTSLGLIDWGGGRGTSMTAGRFADACRYAGLACIGQEIIDWGETLFQLRIVKAVEIAEREVRTGRRTIDCLSLVAKPGSRWDRPNILVNNPNFMGEAFSAHQIASVYTSLGAGNSERQTRSRTVQAAL